MENNEHDNEQAGQMLAEQPVPVLGIDQGEIREIPIREIRIGEFCRRQSYDDLDGLVKSIDKNGLVNPVTVNAEADGRFTLICGSRRLKAHEQLGRESIASRIVRVTPTKAKRLSIQENVHRKDMHPVELARQIQLALDDDGDSQTDIAEEIGMSQPAVSALLGILDLDESIQQQIGTAGESPFTRTHAEILAELLRSTRSNRKVEAQQLFRKTVKHSLGTKELKGLVRVFITGAYTRLPEGLKQHLLHEKGMTYQMAMLYLEPAKIVEGEGAVALRLRQEAERLDRQGLAQQITQAAKANWSFEKAKQRLLVAIQERLDGTARGAAEPKSSGQRLVEDISNLQDRLDICVNEVPGWAQSDRCQLETVCRGLQLLQCKLNEFLETLLNAREANMIEPNMAERGVQHDSVA